MRGLRTPSANLLFLNGKQIAQVIPCTVEDVPLKSVDGDLRRSTKGCRRWHERRQGSNNSQFRCGFPARLIAHQRWAISANCQAPLQQRDSLSGR